ncbi:MAG TPA: hypothetical protein DDW52_02485 [Planctomycetaceae bacterium]|nr:hypothetical protein [Planctomycetaceae bacterium]
MLIQQTTIASFVALVFGMTCAMNTLVPQAVAQPLPVGTPYEQRIELVRTILEPIRSEAEEDASELRQRHPSFLQFYADIDPAWTANFILENPNPNKQILYDNNAIMALMKHATELSPDVIRQLIDAAQFMRGTAALNALKSLPEDQLELRNRVIAWGLESDEKGNGQIYPTMFAALRELAELSSDATIQQRVREQIAEYFHSGKYLELLKGIEPHNRAAYFAMQGPFAPEGISGLGAETDSADAHLLASTILRNDQLSEDEKRSKLAQVSKYSFGTQSHERLNAASQLGTVAVLDWKLALKWAGQAPDVASRIWAKLTIAPAMAKDDSQAAAEMVMECYEELSNSSSKSSSEFIAFSASPANVAGMGLFIVNAICPEQIDKCVDITVSLAKDLRTKKMPQFYYCAMAAVAPFSPQKARDMYLPSSMDVQVSNAGEFLKAVLAIEPESFLSILETLPAQDRSGNAVPIRVHNSVIPTLLIKEQAAYNAALANPNSFLQIPDGVLITP